MNPQAARPPRTVQHLRVGHARKGVRHGVHALGHDVERQHDERLDRRAGRHARRPDLADQRAAKDGRRARLAALPRRRAFG